MQEHRLPDGRVFCRINQTWVSPEERDRTRDYWSEVAFQRGANQGDLSAPQIIRDGMKPVQSMTNGKIYDSKSNLRKEYRRAGVVEVGNEVPMKKAEPTRDEKRRAREQRRGAIAKALSYSGFGAP